MGTERKAVGVADALFTTTQQRVLRLLFGQPERKFFASELISLTGSGSGAVQRELHRLASSGLVSVTLVGKRKYYQANRTSPVFGELHGLVVKTIGIVEPIRRAMAPLTEKIDLALIYGSVPRGGATASSDVDLLVVSDELMLEELYAALADAERVLQRKVHPTLYTTAEFSKRRATQDSFVTRILEGVHTTLIGNAA